MSMLRQIRLSGIVVLAGALPGHAQISAEQVWTMWQDLSANMGYSLTAETQRRDGDRLVLGRVLAGTTTDIATLRLPIAEILMRDRGDGTVEVTMSPSIELTMQVKEPDAEPVDMAMRLDQEGYVAVVSGTPESPKVDFTATSLTMSQIAPKVDGKEVPMTMSAILGGLRGSTTLDRGAATDITYDLTAETLDIGVDATNPETGGTMRMVARARSLSGNFAGTLPQSMPQGAELPVLLNAGLRGNGGYIIGPMTFDFSIEEDGNTAKAQGTASSAQVDIGMDPAGLRYSAGATGLDITASGSAIPFPDFRVTASEYRLGLTLPLTKSETPSDFGLLLRLADLTLPEGVWAMIDPQGRLSRDPATVEVDATGKATLFEDLTSQAAQEPGATIGQFDALTINRLQAKVAGAELIGQGAFPFDNSDMQTFPGIPRPAGTAELTLTGGNALLDNLLALGLVPQDQLMGFRMMLALFTRPGEGPDTLTSKIEMTPEGQILANGQRIQ